MPISMPMMIPRRPLAPTVPTPTPAQQQDLKGIDPIFQALAFLRQVRVPAFEMGDVFRGFGEDGRLFDNRISICHLFSNLLR
jgi:hypothetical protein